MESGNKTKIFFAGMLRVVACFFTINKKFISVVKTNTDCIGRCVQMNKQLKTIVYINVVFFALYLLWNWVEYSILGPLYQVAINAYFPLNIVFSGTTPDGVGLSLFNDVNFGLLFFSLAMLANLYFAYNLQKSIEPNRLS